MLEPLDYDPDQGRELPAPPALVKEIASDIMAQMKEAERTGIAKADCPKCGAAFRILNESRFYMCPCGYYWGFPPKAVQDIIDERDRLRLHVQDIEKRLSDKR
jgi:hypothetical protein